MMNQKIELEDIPLIKALHNEGLTNKEIAEKFEISSSHVSKIIRGKMWVRYQGDQVKQEHKCHCGEKAIVFDNGIHECGACWSQFKKKAVG